MEKFGKVLVMLSILGLAIYPFSIYGSLIFSLLVLLGAGLILKDSKVTKKVLQPFLLLASVAFVKATIAFVWQIMTYFAQLGKNYYGSGFYNFLVKSDYFISAILLLFLLVFGIITIVYMMADKDVPLYGNLSKRLLGDAKVQPVSKVQEAEDVIIETEE